MFIIQNIKSLLLLTAAVISFIFGWGLAINANANPEIICEENFYSNIQKLESSPATTVDELSFLSYECVENSAETPEPTSETTPQPIETTEEIIVKEVIIQKEETTPQIITNAIAINYKGVNIEISKKEIDMIYSVIAHECGNCDDLTQKATTSLILNRVADNRFPNNVYDVLHSPNQFTAINNYYSQKYKVRNSTMQYVSDVIYNSKDYTNGGLYYYAPKYLNNNKVKAWFESLELVFESGGQRYFK